MNKIGNVTKALIALGAFLLLPAAFGAIVYVIGMGGPAVAACAPNPSFLATCVKGSYVLLSTALGGIVWATVVVIELVKYIAKQLKH